LDEFGGKIEILNTYISSVGNLPRNFFNLL